MQLPKRHLQHLEDLCVTDASPWRQHRQGTKKEIANDRDAAHIDTLASSSSCTARHCKLYHGRGKSALDLATTEPENA